MNGRVLLVEDDPADRELLRGALASAGLAVTAAGGGAEALERLASDVYELVVCDLVMPGLGGLSVLAEVKRRSPATEVILVSGKADSGQAWAAVGQGAFAFVRKPWDKAELLALTAQALEKSELKAMNAVYLASQAVFRAADLADLLAIVTRIAADMLKADDVSVLVLRDGALELAASSDPELAGRTGLRLALGERVAGRAAAERRTFVLSGALEADLRFPALPGLRRVSAAIVHPLVLGADLVGVINVNRLQAGLPFTPLAERHLAIFGAYVAQALRNAETLRRLNEKIAALETAEDRLVRAGKLAAVGAVAARVAHELNNPLTGVLASAHELGAAPDLPLRLREAAATAVEGAERCRRVVADLLNLGRRGEPQLRATPLVELVEAALRHCAPALQAAGAGVERCWGETPVVRADPFQLEQVFCNLVTNAAHALEGRRGGRLAVSVARSGGRASVRFADTGRGIPAEHQARLFEPFFTTKPEGKGTGLGLSVCRDIVTRHGGEIRIESVPGRGTTAVVELPL